MFPKTWSLPVNQQRQQTFLVSGEPEPFQCPAAQSFPVIAAIANIFSHAFRGASIHFAKTCSSEPSTLGKSVDDIAPSRVAPPLELKL
jgi:hypothetical protein